jgi:hypothetical protein
MKQGRTEILQREGGNAGDENRDNPNRKPAANEPTPAVTTGSPPPHNHLDVPVLGHYLLLPAAAVLGSRLEAHPTTEELGAVGVPYHRRRTPQTKGDPPSYGDHGSRRRNGLHNNILWISPASRASTLRPTVALGNALSQLKPTASASSTVIVEPLCSEQRGLLSLQPLKPCLRHKTGLFKGFLHEAVSTNSPLATFAIAIG